MLAHIKDVHSFLLWLVVSTSVSAFLSPCLWKSSMCMPYSCFFSLRNHWALCWRESAAAQFCGGRWEKEETSNRRSGKRWVSVQVMVSTCFVIVAKYLISVVANCRDGKRWGSLLLSFLILLVSFYFKSCKYVYYSTKWEIQACEKFI